MELTADDICDLVQEIWTSFLQLDVLPCGPTAPPPESLSGLIHIHGAWEGSVVVHTSRALATHVAGVMFDQAPADLAPGDVDDALGEIVNMLGGSVKSLVGGPASLSLPTVVGGAQHTLSVPGAADLNTVWLTSAGEPLTVRVLERASTAVPAVPA